MALLEIHCQDCVIALGEPFTEVHAWLDEFWPTLGPAHRYVRHHTAGIEEVRRMWGDRAATAAIIHIKKDFYGQIPTVEETQLWLVLDGGTQSGQQERGRVSGGRQDPARVQHGRKGRDLRLFDLHPGIEPGPLLRSRDRNNGKV